MIVLYCQVELVVPSSDRGNPCNTNFTDFEDVSSDSFVTVTTLWTCIAAFLDIYLSIY